MAEQFLREITLCNNHKIEYILDVKKRKNMYICISSGSVVLKISPAVTVSQAEEFLVSKSDWIMQKLASSNCEKRFIEEYSDNENFMLAGKRYIINLINTDKYFEPYFDDDRLIISVRTDCMDDYVKSQVDKAICNEASEIIGESFQRLSKKTGLVPSKVTIKNLTASWGRCSSKGNISINFKIVFYDQQCIDYVVLHELCHLKHMDHSENFWSLVLEYCPDWKMIRARLR